MSVQALSRQSQRISHSNGDDQADESSSWLGDDVCASCGAPARPNHLYCSQECKEEDAKQIDAAKTNHSSTSATVLSLPASSSSKKTGTSPFLTEANQINDSTKFRYPCPTSPNIVAKYNSALTSPALVALERSLPNTNQPATNTTKGSHSISSSGDSSGIARAKSSKRRSSSRSTFSSASDVISTEHSTPQSTSDAIQDDDEYALDASDFHLPPSIRPSSIMLSSTAKEGNMAVTPSSSVTPDGTTRSPMSKITPTSHRRSLPSKTSSQTDAARKTLDFARRPSSTNVPPALAMTSPMLKPFPGSNGRSTRRMSARHSQPSLQEAQATLRGRKATTSSRAIPAFANTQKAGKGVETVSKMGMLSQHHHREGDDSPPQLASVSSSADKTLRALSPFDSAAPASHSTVCGRYECCGLGNSIDSLEEAGTANVSTTSRRPSMVRGHKHTHSAAAGLNLLAKDHGTSITATSKLLMTPVAPKAELEDDGLVKEDSTDSNGASFEERVRNPPRGRSKARGRRSASHRSRSPARGGARRGRSEDLKGEVEDEPSVHISPASGRSQPMALPHSRRSSADAQSGEEGVVERRGRSLTERDVPLRTFRSRTREQTSSTVTSGDNLEDSCEMAWPGYGHDMDTQGSDSRTDLKQKIASALLHGSKGYDDVDLDEL